MECLGEAKKEEFFGKLNYLQAKMYDGCVGEKCKKSTPLIREELCKNLNQTVSRNKSTDHHLRWKMKNGRIEVTIYEIGNVPGDGPP